MINVDELKRFVELISNKNQNGQFSVERFNDALPKAEMQLLNEFYGLPQRSNNGRTANDQYWQSTEYASNVIRKFLVPPTTIIVDGNGYAQKPSNFFQLSSMRVAFDISQEQHINNSCNDTFLDCADEGDCIDTINSPSIGKEVGAEFVPDAEIEMRLSSNIIAPTQAFPIFCVYENVFKFYPESTGQAKLTYIRYPVRSRWGYTISPSGRPVYDPATSTDSEFDYNLINELAMRICSMLGIHLSRVELLQYAEGKINTGM